MLRKIYKALWGMRRYEKLLRVPRQYANPLNVNSYDPDMALIMGRSSARSPANVRALMKKYAVATVDELLPLLPSQRYRRNARRRLLSLIRSIAGVVEYNPNVRLYHQLERRGHFARPEIHDRIERARTFK